LSTKSVLIALIVFSFCFFNSQYVDDEEAEGSGGTPVDNAVAVNQTSDAVAESESSEEETDTGADSQPKNTLAGDSDEETEDDDTSE